MKPLSAAEIELLQTFANGLGTTDIAASRRTTAQVIKNYTYLAPKIRTQFLAQRSLGDQVKECPCGAFLFVTDYCSLSRR